MNYSGCKDIWLENFQTESKRFWSEVEHNIFGLNCQHFAQVSLSEIKHKMFGLNC